jgi:hypothetical protein
LNRAAVVRRRPRRIHLAEPLQQTSSITGIHLT